jgi:hypothetical protein
MEFYTKLCTKKIVTLSVQNAGCRKYLDFQRAIGRIEFLREFWSFT